MHCKGSEVSALEKGKINIGENSSCYAKDKILMVHCGAGEGAAGAGRGRPLLKLSGTIPHGCCCILRVGSFGALPQNGYWKIHVRVELLGSAPMDVPEACAGQAFTLQGASATFYYPFQTFG